MTKLTPPDVGCFSWTETTIPGVYFSRRTTDTAAVLRRAGTPAGWRADQTVSYVVDYGDGITSSPTVSPVFTITMSETDPAELAAWAAAVPAALEEVQRETRRRRFGWMKPALQREAETLRRETAALLEQYGQFTVLANEARGIIAQEVILEDEIKRLRKVVKGTPANARAKELEVRDRRQQPDVPLTDDEVEAAIRVLTSLDRDHAEMENGVGWSKATSSGGHWCYAVLATHRELAIKEGRRLIAVGGHLGQLRGLGIGREAA